MDGGGDANDRIRELERQLADKDSTLNNLISFNREQLQAKDRQLKEEKEAKDRQLEAKDQQLEEANAEKATIREEANRRLEENNRQLEAKDQQLEEANAEKATIREEANRRLEENDRQLDIATQRHEDVMRELRSTRVELRSTQSEIQFTRETLQREIVKLERLLQWKSSTSTRNPDKDNLTHKFIITAGRKRGVFGAPRRVEDVMLVDPDGTPRDPITKEETPTLRAGEFTRLSFLSRQERSSAQAIHEHRLRGEVPLLQGYMAGGIDFRQNVKTVAKRARRRHEPQQVIDLTGAPAAKKLKR